MASFIESIRNSLNPQQMEAVEHTEGPLLILAGAGSGKTRVLTSRIAHLVHDHKFSLDQILAMTFSNKAAREMHDRLKVLLNDQSPNRYPWISTFHSVGVRLLRRYGVRIGINPDFVIYDTNDQLDIIKDCFKEMNISDKSFAPKAIHARISAWKNEGRRWDQTGSVVSSQMDQVATEVYEKYFEKLRKAQALDFDDLLLETYQLLLEAPEVRDSLQARWAHVLVDEFQDTNLIQYRVLQSIVNSDHNLCVVGDDDQSIYGWRGAKVENILEFDRQFEGCKVIRLEQNYRSTGNILEAASAVIHNNERRHSKKLWTDKGEGEKIRLAVLEDDRSEARFIVNEIRRYLRQDISAADIAVLYRVNSVSRQLEEECLRQKVPYQIVGGFRFYERKEIKDVMAYLKFLMNPSDIVAFRRCINSPARGIGKKSIEKLEDAAGDQKLLDYLLNTPNLPITGKAKTGIKTFIDFMRWGRDQFQAEASLTDLFVGAVEKTGYLAELQKEKSEEARDREANLQELLSAVQEFEEQWSFEGRDEQIESESQGDSELKYKLFDFLERVALISDADNVQNDVDEVTFMSIHAAKGLEYKICFLAAFEDGLFPSLRSLDDPDSLEEERRLCYVGITRAKEKLYITRAERRRTFGNINYQIPSRFVKEIPSKLYETIVDESERDDSYSAFRSKPRKSASYDEFNQDAGFDYEFSQEYRSFNYATGDQVTHPSFGAGVVKKVEMLGSDECLTIEFRSKGKKRVLSQFVSKCA